MKEGLAYIWRPPPETTSSSYSTCTPAQDLHRNSKIWRSISTASFTAKTPGSLCVLQPDIASSWKNLIRDVKGPQLLDSGRSVAVATVPCRVPARGSSASNPPAHSIPPSTACWTSYWQGRRHFPVLLPCYAILNTIRRADKQAWLQITQKLPSAFLFSEAWLYTQQAPRDHGSGTWSVCKDLTDTSMLFARYSSASKERTKLQTMPNCYQNHATVTMRYKWPFKLHFWWDITEYKVFTFTWKLFLWSRDIQRCFLEASQSTNDL